MNWSVSEAKARFSEVIDKAGEEPQIIENRGNPVATIFNHKETEEYLEYKRKQARPTLADFIKQAQEACQHEPDLEIEPRSHMDRPLDLS